MSETIKYDMAKLDAATLEKIQAKIESVTPLLPNIRYSIELAERTKGLFYIKCPHYLFFGSEDKDGYLENVGFIGQQMRISLMTAACAS